jgi:hypothetical protein
LAGVNGALHAASDNGTHPTRDTTALIYINLVGVRLTHAEQKD